MGTAESPFDPLVLRDVVVPTFGWIWVVPENRDDGIGLVENDHSSVQIRNRNEVALDSDRGGHTKTGDDFVDKLSVEAIVDQSAFRLVVPVADEQSGWFVASVKSHAVCGVELFEPVPLGSEMAQVLSVFVVAENMVAGVSIRQVDITVWSNSDCCRIELL